MRLLCSLVVALLCSAPADAAPFTWLIEGRVTTARTTPAGPYAGLFAAGQPFTWSVTMDSAAPDFNSNPACGQYTPIVGTRFTSGAVNLWTTGKPAQDYLLHSASYGAGSGYCEGPPGPNIARVRSGYSSSLMLAMHFAGAFTTDALPVDPAGLWAVGTFDIFYAGFDNAIANGSVTSITSVPEPVAALLILTGLAAGLRRQNRRAR